MLIKNNTKFNTPFFREYVNLPKKDQNKQKDEHGWSH